MNMIFKTTINSIAAFAAAVAFALFAIGVPAVSASSSTFADAKTSVCEGIGGCDPATDEPTIDGTIATVIDILSLVVGVVAVIMIVVGGLKYVTSQGDSSGTASAKNTIIYALVGLVIVALAQVLVRLVVNRAV